MFFIISKLLWFFLQPSNLVLFFLFFGIALLWSKWSRIGRRIVLAAGVAFLVGGLSPLGHVLILPLENRFSRADLSSGQAPEGIIVLGGAQSMSIEAARRVVNMNEAGERLIEVVVLARRFPNAKILFSGGSGGLFGERASEAEAAAKLFISLGVDEKRLILEDKSRNTYQNALFSKKLIKQPLLGRWLLVTSANHMPRSIGSFHSIGLSVEPWPVDYRTRGRKDIGRFFTRASDGWRRIDIAMREWTGLVAYWFTGRTQSLFPDPDSN